MTSRTPSDMVVFADERQSQRLLGRALRAARRWAGWVHELSDPELLGLSAQCERELRLRGLDR